MHDVSSEYPNKFNVFTQERTYELFSKTRTERELWIEHFCKVIDKNAGKTVDFNKPSETYTKLQEAERQGITSSSSAASSPGPSTSPSTSDYMHLFGIMHILVQFSRK